MTTLSLALGVTCAPAGHAMTIARSALAAIHVKILNLIPDSFRECPPARYLAITASRCDYSPAAAAVKSF
jgi:hypothetical protein